MEKNNRILLYHRPCSQIPNYLEMFQYWTQCNLKYEKNNKFVRKKKKFYSLKKFSKIHFFFLIFLFFIFFTTFIYGVVCMTTSMKSAYRILPPPATCGFGLDLGHAVLSRKFPISNFCFSTKSLYWGEIRTCGVVRGLRENRMSLGEGVSCIWRILCEMTSCVGLFWELFLDFYNSEQLLWGVFVYPPTFLKQKPKMIKIYDQSTLDQKWKILWIFPKFQLQFFLSFLVFHRIQKNIFFCQRKFTFVFSKKFLDPYHKYSQNNGLFLGAFFYPQKSKSLISSTLSWSSFFFTKTCILNRRANESLDHFCIFWGIWNVFVVNRQTCEIFWSLKNFICWHFFEKTISSRICRNW